MDINQLEPGIYYQDILEDGSRSVIRQNFPTLKRTSFDKQPSVKQTLMISVQNYQAPPEYGLHLDPVIYTGAYDIFESPSGTDVPLGTPTGRLKSSEPEYQTFPSIKPIDPELKKLFCKHDWSFELGDHEGVTKKTCTICNKIEFEHA